MQPKKHQRQTIFFHAKQSATSKPANDMTNLALFHQLAFPAGQLSQVPHSDHGIVLVGATALVASARKAPPVVRSNQEAVQDVT